MNWFHKLLKPHCPECAAEELEKKSCQTCDMLRELLDREKNEKQQLLNSILRGPIEEKVVVNEPVVVRGAKLPWRVKQGILEREDRKRAELLKEKLKEINDLEKEVLVDDTKDKQVEKQETA